MTTALTVQCEDLLIGEQVDVLTVYEGLLKGEQVDVLTVNDCLLKVEQVDVLTLHEGLFRQAVQADVYTASIWAGGCSICYLRTVQMIFGTSSGTSGRMDRLSLPTWCLVMISPLCNKLISWVVFLDLAGRGSSPLHLCVVHLGRTGCS